MLPAHLQELVDFHAPLSTLQRQQGGAVTLLTPGVNVLALNATFLSEDPGEVNLDAVRDWHRGQGVPVLVASTGPLVGAREVARVMVGHWQPNLGPAASDVAVEQISRLHLGPWADVLAGAHGTPEWGDALARHLAPRLEGDRQSVLLMAHGAGAAVGALLWRENAAHLWGARHGAATGPLLRAAFDLGGSLRLSCPVGDPTQPGEARAVVYSLLD